MRCCLLNKLGVKGEMSLNTVFKQLLSVDVEADRLI